MSAGGRFQHLLPAADGTRPTCSVVGIDPSAGWVVLARSATSPHDHPTGLLPTAPPSDRAFRGVLHDLGEQVAVAGIDGPGPMRAACTNLAERSLGAVGGPLRHPDAEVRDGPQRQRGCAAAQGPGILLVCSSNRSRPLRGRARCSSPSKAG